MNLPSIDAMFPQLTLGPPAAVAAVVGGPIGKQITDEGWETCCIRLSRALNYSGAPVAGWQGMANPYMGAGGKVRAMQGADSKWYIYSCYDLRVYLTNRFGHPKKFKGNADETTVAGVPGVIMFGFLHVDLWNGSAVCNHAYFGDPRVTSEGVYIWPAGTTT